jgi:hypothetical protein
MIDIDEITEKSIVLLCIVYMFPYIQRANKKGKAARPPFYLLILPPRLRICAILAPF